MNKIGDMEFERKKIQTEREISPRKQKVKKIIVIIIIVLIAFYGIKALITKSGLKTLVFSIGTSLQADENGYTNFLLAGTGGELHEGADLTDSLMVASLDNSGKTAEILSIPRDLYVDTTLGSEDRINKVYTLAKDYYQDSQKGMETLENVVSKVIGNEIHYYIRVNFEGFSEIIDAIDGVDMYIDETIDDPFYPKEGTIKYEPFYLTRGTHHLDGETALKYARSRKTTSDFDRSSRQQKLLFAIKDEIVKKKIINDPDKIKEIFLDLRDNIETDLSIRELIKLAEIGENVSESKIKTYLIHDDPSKCGGFLYTPDRNLYSGAFVLVPASNPYVAEDSYKYLHFFTQNVFNNHKIETENIKIQILNGTQKPGLAAITKVLLNRNCFSVIRFGNGRDLGAAETRIFAKTETALNSETVKVIKKFLGLGEISSDVPQEYLNPPYLSEAEIIIELGRDYAVRSLTDPFDYLVDIQKPEENDTEGTESENTDTEAAGDEANTTGDTKTTVNE